MGRPSSTTQGGEAHAVKRPRTAEEKEQARADMGRSYLRRVKWPKIVKTLRAFAADPSGFDGGVLLAFLTPLLLEPSRPVPPLPPRRALPADVLDAGKLVERRYFADRSA